VWSDKLDTLPRLQLNSQRRQAQYGSRPAQQHKVGVTTPHPVPEGATEPTDARTPIIIVSLESATN
jgi:hypothetical protein